MAAISNVATDGTIVPEQDNDDVVKVLKGNMGWHHDSTSCRSRPRARCSAPRSCRRGGRTGWADMRAAYDALDDGPQGRGSPACAYHRCTTASAKLGHVAEEGRHDYSGYGFHDGQVPLRPLVKAHPETGRKSLLVGRHAHNIPGLVAGRVGAPLPGADRLRLPAAAHLPPRVDRGDAVMWDNRCLMHQATPWDMTQRRIMWHSRIAGDVGERGGAGGLKCIRWALCASPR